MSRVCSLYRLGLQSVVAATFQPRVPVCGIRPWDLGLSGMNGSPLILLLERLGKGRALHTPAESWASIGKVVQNITGIIFSQPGMRPQSLNAVSHSLMIPGRGCRNPHQALGTWHWGCLMPLEDLLGTEMCVPRPQALVLLPLLEVVQARQISRSLFSLHLKAPPSPLQPQHQPPLPPLPPTTERGH